MASGIVYEITCNACEDPVDPNGVMDCPGSRRPGGQPRPNYVGSTMTTLHARMESHLRSQKYKQQSNPLHRHDTDVHGGEAQQYTTRVLGREKTLLPLRILESLYIEGQAEGTTLNARNEFGRGGLIRLEAIRE